jgi:hypothetical protein
MVAHGFVPDQSRLAILLTLGFILEGIRVSPSIWETLLVVPLGRFAVDLGSQSGFLAKSREFNFMIGHCHFHIGL